ncbi:MAG: TetR/AcrR family transcriptional regulator [Planctomycetota bacterium]
MTPDPSQPFPASNNAHHNPPANAGETPQNTDAQSPTAPRAQLDQRQILEATDAALREVGYDKTTIRHIAKRLNCAVGSIYRYFTDKRELLTAVTQRRFDAVAQHAELGSPLDRTLALYHRLALERPELYHLMFWLTSVGQPDPTQTTPLVIRRTIAGWSAQLRDPSAAQQLWATLHAGITLGHPLTDILQAARRLPATADLPSEAQPAEATV